MISEPVLAGIQALFDERQQMILEQAAMIDRYRDALDLIAQGEVGDWSNGDPRRVLALREIAREALNGSLDAKRKMRGA